jgi:hypothetical protein
MNDSHPTAELKRLATELNGYSKINLHDQCATLAAREVEILELKS